MCYTDKGIVFFAAVNSLVRAPIIFFPKLSVALSGLVA